MVRSEPSNSISLNLFAMICLMIPFNLLGVGFSRLRAAASTESANITIAASLVLGRGPG